MVIIVICFKTEEKIYKFKADNKNVNFSTQFFLESISNKFDHVESEEASFKENVFDFSVDYDGKYLMVKIT